MKIVFLHQTMGLISRGSEVSTQMIANALAKNHQVTVIQSGSKTKQSYQTIVINKITGLPPVTPINIFDKILSRIVMDKRSRMVSQFTSSCVPAINKIKPDVIIATNGAAQIRALQCAKVNAKIVVFGRAGIGHDDLANLRAKPNLFIALSEQALTWATKYKHSLTHLAFIPNPIDPGIYKKAKPINLNLKHPIVLTVSALSSYKNTLQVVRAAKEMNISLVIVGDGEQADKLAKELSSYPAEFSWIRSLEPQDLPSYYRAADAFCFVPDHQEAFGRVYLEAMASGLPIVASDDPIRRRIVGLQGYYSNPHDKNKLKQQITLAVNQDKLSYQKELVNYNLSSVVKQIEKEFHELV